MEPSSRRAQGLAAVVIGLGGLSVAAGKLDHPIPYPAGDIRGALWFIALSTMVTVVSASALIVYGLWRLWRDRGRE